MDHFDNQIDAIIQSLKRLKGSQSKVNQSNDKDQLFLIAAQLGLDEKLENATLLKELLTCAMHVVFGEGAAITLYDKEKHKLVFKAAVGLGSEGIVGQEVPINNSIHGIAFASANIQSSTPIFEDVEESAKAQFNSVLVAPLSLDDEVIGTMSVVNKIGSDHFNADDIEAFAHFAEVTTTVVQKQLSLDKLKAIIENGPDQELVSVMKIARDLKALTPYEGGIEQAGSLISSLLNALKSNSF